MESLGNVLYISTLGLGTEIEIELFTFKEKLFVVSQMSGKYVEVKWREKDKSIMSILEE